MGLIKKLKRKKVFRKAYGLSTAAQRAVGSAVTGKKFRLVSGQKISKQFKTASAGNLTAITAGKSAAGAKQKIANAKGKKLNLRNRKNLNMSNKKKGKLKRFVQKHGKKAKKSLSRQVKKRTKSVGGSVNFGANSSQGYIPVIIAIAVAIVIAFGSGMVKLKKGRR